MRPALLPSNYFRKGDVHAYDHAVIAEMSHYITQCFAIQLTHKRNYTTRLCYKCMYLIPIMFWKTMFYRVIHTGASDQNFLCMVYLRHWNYHYVFYRTLRFTQWNGCVILVLWNSLNTNIFHLLRGACMFWFEQHPVFTRDLLRINGYGVKIKTIGKYCKCSQPLVHTHASIMFTMFESYCLQYCLLIFISWHSNWNQSTTVHFALKHSESQLI